MVEKSIENLFESKNYIFYILTNFRSMSENKTKAIHKKIAENISEISKNTKKDFVLISRSDSTLRGHYPLEMRTLKSTFSKNLNINYTHEIIITAFFECGRYTFNDIHWVKENDSLTPCSETEFSNDPQFGYKNSNLKKWIEEKTKKKISADDVLSISIKDIREGGPDKIKKQGRISNRRFIRKKSTEQLDLLLKNGKNILPILLNVNKVLDRSEDEIERITKLAINSLNVNKTPVIYTSRKLKVGENALIKTYIGNAISSCSVTITKKIITGSKTKPDYLLTKGGITSSDIITNALGIKKVLVLGQLYPGISILKVFTPEKFVNLSIIIFPSNVGNQNTFLEIYNKIRSN